MNLHPDQNPGVENFPEANDFVPWLMAEELGIPTTQRSSRSWASATVVGRQQPEQPGPRTSPGGTPLPLLVPQHVLFVCSIHSPEWIACRGFRLGARVSEGIIVFFYGSGR